MVPFTPKEGTRSLHDFATSHGYFAPSTRPQRLRGRRSGTWRLGLQVRQPGAAHPAGTSESLLAGVEPPPDIGPMGRSLHGNTRQTARTLCSGWRPPARWRLCLHTGARTQQAPSTDARMDQAPGPWRSPGCRLEVTGQMVDTNGSPGTVAEAPRSAALSEAEIREIVRLEIERSRPRDPGTKTATIIASKGTLDWG